MSAVSKKGQNTSKQSEIQSTERKSAMKITFDRSDPIFWVLYFLLHFCFLLAVLFFVRWLWSLLMTDSYRIDLGEMTFESIIYAIAMTVARIIRYRIGKKRYEKNPVDRRKNNLFRE